MKKNILVIVMLGAIIVSAGAGYNLAFPWGVLGFGLSTGCNIQPTSAEAAFMSVIFSIPAAAYVRYTTNCTL